MAPKRKSAGKSTQRTLLTGGFDFEKYPQLKKPLETVGACISVPGSFWDKCQAADKDKRFKCVIVDYSIALSLSRTTRGSSMSLR